MIPLPIDPFLPEIVAAVASRRAAVIVAAPGAGKTTRLPPAILAARLLGREHPHLVMLQPRRVAARAAALRIAEENDWTVGRQVGYQVRFERVMDKQTRLRVVTEGILTRQLMDDPFLEGVGAVVLDEFHERSIHTDMALALLREVRQSVRDDLILLVMSATLDAGPVAAFLGDCPIIQCPGRAFDVQIEHRPPSGRDITDRVAEEIELVLAQPASATGDVLAFLPGPGEIRQIQQSLARSNDWVLPLYGRLPFDEQVRALQPSDRRKVILATNVAETSLTIPGVRTVIDSGLARQASYDPQRGLDQLQLTRISKASATQRAGRAGRVAPGRCIRLWTAREQAELHDFDLPEMQRVDLSSTVLSLHAWGRNEPRGFGWYEPPPEKSLAAAERLLWLLGALSAESSGRITPLGKRMQVLPVHPRLGRLLIGAADRGFGGPAAAIAALLSEREMNPNQAPRQVHGQSDLLILLERPSNRNIARLKDDLHRLVGQARGRSDRVPDEAELLKLILLAYPDRVCRRRASDPERGVMVGGGGVRVARESAVRTAEFFIAVDASQDHRSARSEALVRIASAIAPDWLTECFPDLVTRNSFVRFDPARGRVAGVAQMRYLDLIISETADAAVDPLQAAQALVEALRPAAAEIFAADDASASVLARIDFLRHAMPEHPWPQFDAATLAGLLEEACAGKRGVEEVKRQPLAEFLVRRLEYPLDRLLQQHAPANFELPSGKSIRLRYEPGRAPVLAARLQELFGLKKTPRLAAGRVPVVLEILGPNYRPVQVTDDLASFWATAYFQVRKDLRRRYPKHAWPDDPSIAQPRVRK